MMEEVKEILHMIEKLPHMTLWVLGGFALYKLLTYASLVGSVTMILRLAILKGFDAYSLPRTVRYKFRKEFLDEDAKEKMDELLTLLHSPGLIYIHGSCVEDAIRAVKKAKGLT
jgi:hypothetical protein